MNHSTPTISGQTPFRDHAENLASEGWPVFPCVPRSKTPYSDSHGHLDATRDRATIRRWAQERPAANIGLRPPANVVVVDIDNGKAFRAWRTTRGLDLPVTRTVKTSGGWHLYYRLPDGLEVPSRGQSADAGQVLLAAGVPRVDDRPPNTKQYADLKTCRGFVLAPGSVHESSYVYALERDTPVVELPARWLPVIERRRVEPHPAIKGASPDWGATDRFRLVRLLSVKRAGDGRRDFLRFCLGAAYRHNGGDPELIDRLCETAVEIGLDRRNVEDLRDWFAREMGVPQTPATGGVVDIHAEEAV